MDDDAWPLHLDDVERGEVLVNERVLLSGETKLGQKRSFFHTRCKCNGKCSNVIVDGGSTDNLVSEEMISKIKLKRENTPIPIKLLGCKMIIRS